MESDELFDIPIAELKNYKITKRGDIWSCFSKRFLKTRLNNRYYGFTRTVKDGDKNIVKSYYIHRLIALVFIPNPNNYLIVNHINGIKTDNDISNLEWVTQKENINKSSKETSHSRKVQQLENNIVINTFDSVTKASESIGLSRSAISKACLNINKTAGGYIWKYEDSTHEHVDINSIDLTKAKSIYEYDNYFVFDDGQIFNNSRKKFLKPVKNASGYCYVTLSKNGIKKNHYIHLIVVDHFLEQKRMNLQVNHKNKVRDDNRLSNLELVTHSENMIHAYNTS